ncbi:dihydrodipicolinate synthase family protein [Castellaniella hirudinis]|uniref:dihydrodipicolinate synthase family protein n=1 Tax=Castellaniella hirudinis TaxID=1144617 RepID=UPI0039C1E038
MPALVTPFDSNGRVDFAAFEKLLTALRAAGVSGWVPMGSTGEYYSMTDAERDAVLQFVKDFALPGEGLIAGANATTTQGVIENVLRAQRIGYDTVLLPTPFYTRPTQAELLAYYRAVLDATDANLILYSYPDKDGVEVSFEVMDALADHPRVLGIKESSGRLQRAIDIHARYDGRIALISGSDDIALDFMLWGADCWICGPANCMAQACVDLDRTFRSGDLSAAREKMAVLYRAMNILESGKFVQKIKYGCELQGLPVGLGRAPLGELSTEEKAAFKAAVAPLFG